MFLYLWNDFVDEYMYSNVRHGLGFVVVVLMADLQGVFWSISCVIFECMEIHRNSSLTSRMCSLFIWI